MVIYEIKNNSNGKRYIGCSVNYKRRWNEHRSDLEKNKHINPHLQSAWNLYGEDVFEFNVLLKFDNQTDMFLEELRLIESEDMLYNIAKGGTGGDTFTNNPNKENIRKKMTISNRKKIGLNRNPFLDLTPDELIVRKQIWSDASKGSKNGRFKYDRKVNQIDKKTRKVIKTYDYVRLVDDDGYNSKYVIHCCNKKQSFSSHKGYLWEWVE